MSTDFIRNKFIDKYGYAKYKEFVLSLYESFPRQDDLLFWQEKLITELFKELNFQKFGLEDVYTIFNYCPVHNVELLNDNVPIINGNEYKEYIDFDLRKQLVPLANTNAPRDIDRFQHPKSIDILYCPTCRDIQLMKRNSK